MQELVKDYIIKLIDEKNLSDEDVYLYLILMISTFFAGIMHVILLLVMLAIGLPFLVGINVISISIYTLALVRLIKKRRYTSAGVIIAGEVIFYILTVSLYIGTSHYVILYCFVILFMQLTIPYGGIKARVMVSAAVWISMIVSLQIGEYRAPMQATLSPENGMMLLMTNVNLAFGGVIIQLVSSNMIRKIIADSNAARLEKYKNQAHTDPLTGLYNRRYAKDFFASIINRSTESPWCVAMLDIDDFKQVNDILGHQAGDEVLRNLSNVLKANTRKTDLLFRWGGEEFLLFLPDIEFESAVKILNKILQQIANTPLIYDQNAVRITVTIGACRLDVNDIESSIELCDKRLYLGKSSGKNQVVFGDVPSYEYKTDNQLM